MKQEYKTIFDSLKESGSSDKNKNSRVLIVDGMNAFIRTWSNMPNLNELGDHVGGAVGTLQSIGVAVRKLNPSRVIIVFDGSGGSVKRKKLYSGYKSGREKNKIRVNRQYEHLMSDEDERESMKRQFVWLNDIITQLPITTMIYDNIEADDVIAYICTQLIKENEESIIMSVDRDFYQLIDEKTKVWQPVSRILFDKETLEKKYGIISENFLLYRTIDGDGSDKINGVKGVGIKTLLQRIPEFQTEPFDYDKLYKICEERRGTVKFYDSILESKGILDRNFRLMQLKEPEISGQTKMKIMSKFDEKTKPIKKLDFMKTLVKYKMQDNFGNINNWINLTWNKLITD